MEITGTISGILLLSVMSWQDFKSRLISAWLLPAIGLALVFAELPTANAQDILEHTCYNLVVLGIIFLALTLWMSVRERRIVKIIDNQIGLGDMLLFVCLAPVFSPLNFILFFTLGNMIALLICSIYFALTSKAEKRVPLAGFFGLALIALVALRCFGVIDVHLSDDSWLTNYIFQNQHS